MNDRAWEELIDLIDNKYEVDVSDRREEALEDNKKLKQTIESIGFEKDNIKYKIERITSPRVVDKKTFVYEPEETSTKVYFYKQLPDGNYNEITPEELMANS